MTDFSSGHDLEVCEFEPSIRLYADSSEPEACFRFCVSLSRPLPRSCSVSASQRWINVKKKKLKSFSLKLSQYSRLFILLFLYYQNFLPFIPKRKFVETRGVNLINQINWMNLSWYNIFLLLWSWFWSRRCFTKFWLVLLEKSMKHFTKVFLF